MINFTCIRIYQLINICKWNIKLGGSSNYGIPVIPKLTLMIFLLNIIRLEIKTANEYKEVELANQLYKNL